MESSLKPELDGQRILLTGATGYIGGRLVPRLLAARFRVRCVVRSARKLDARLWVVDPWVEVIECNLEDSERLSSAMKSCTAARDCFQRDVVRNSPRGRGIVAPNRAEWSLNTGQVAKSPEGLGQQALLVRDESVMGSAVSKLQWTINYCPMEIGIQYPKRRA